MALFEDRSTGPFDVHVSSVGFKNSVKEASRRFEEMAARLASDPRSFRDLSPEERRERLQQVMGAGRGLFSSSEEFARQKQEEIDLEEERFGRR
ncbi:MAG TPA: hypothetical protein VFR31_02985 [Thermoanaerobaculia bacterium]|nr:hypothetical protein [Thermoanaerobaculia bacterium]